MARILLVDDSSFQRKNLAKMLNDAGHEVIVAENGEIGLGQAVTERPDLILTDLLMPVMDGISFMRGLKARKLAIPVIVASADVQDATREECLRLGATSFLTKPVDGADLTEAIAKALKAVPEESTRC